MLTRRVVKLTRADVTPGSVAKPPSSLEMQPAQRSPSTAKTLVAVLTPVPHR
jgi:hypothetical protein